MFLSPLRCELFKYNNIAIFSRCLASLSNNINNLETIFTLPNNDTKLLKVGIIGTPNAGKSTFINNLMDRKVCPTSSKVHTTRSKSMAIFTQGDSQIIFLDTPGLVNEKEQHKFNLESSFIRDSTDVLKEVDIVGVIHDVSNIYTREKLDIKVIKLLEKHTDKPSFLIFNKVDLLKSKRKLLDLIRLVTDNCLNGKPISRDKTHRLKNEHSETALRAWPNFQEIFMVSALTGDGLADIKEYLVKKAKPAKWMFPEEVWTDQSAENIIIKSVQAKLLDFLPQEIPYKLKTEMEYFDINEAGKISTVVLVQCPSSRIAKLVAGAANGKIRQITESIQGDLQNAFQNYVNLRIELVSPPKE